MYIMCLKITARELHEKCITCIKVLTIVHICFTSSVVLAASLHATEAGFHGNPRGPGMMVVMVMIIINVDVHFNVDVDFFMYNLRLQKHEQTQNKRPLRYMEEVSNPFEADF